MSEHLEATSVLHPDQQTDLLLTGYETIGGGNETKRLLECTIGGRNVSLVERPFDQDYIDAWIAFRKAEMPVVPTLRRSANNSLLVTDVKANGDEVYGKPLNVILTEGQEKRTRIRPEIDKLFLDIAAPSNFSVIRTEAQRLTERANDNSLRLPYDDPFELIIHPDGTWGLITLDLRFARVYSPERSNPKRLQEAKEMNVRNVEDFLRSLSSLHEHFTGQALSRRQLPFGRLLRWIK